MNRPPLSTNHPIILLTAIALLLLVCGCNKTQPEDESNATDEVDTDVVLNVLVIDSPAIAATAGRRWAAEGMGSVEFQETSSSQLAENNFELASDIDLVIYPTELLPDFVAHDQLLDIPKKYLDSEVVNRNEMMRHQRNFLQRLGRDVYSLPLGDTYLTLVYNKKVFAEMDLDVPVTWREYTLVAKALREAGHQVEEPFADGWASRTFLSRAAAYVRSRGKVSTVFDIATMNPLIDQQPFPQCMDEIKEALGSEIDTDLTPKQIFQNLLANKTAMGLTWPSRHFADESTQPNEEIGVARLPGSQEWYNRLESTWQTRDGSTSVHMDLMGVTGRVVSVAKGSRYTKVSIDFASWICSKITSTSVSIESPHVSIYRATHLGQPGRWTGEQISPTAADEYGDVIKAISDSNIVFLFPRIAGQPKYLAAMDDAVRRCLNEGVSPAESLKKAAQEWNQITDGLDRESQRKQLRRSEGFDN